MISNLSDNTDNHLAEFCKNNGIANPKIFLNRRKSDNLSQSIKAEASRNVDVLGVRLFRVYNFDGLHVVDSTELHRCLQAFDQLFKERELCFEFERIVDNSDARLIEAAAEIEKGEYSSSIDVVSRFIELRKSRAPVKYVHKIYTDIMVRRLTSILNETMQPYHTISLEDLHFMSLHRYAFMSVQEPLEVTRIRLYRELVLAFREKDSDSPDFNTKFEYFFSNYYNLDYTRLDRLPKSKEDLLREIEGIDTIPTVLSHDEGEVKSGKRNLFVNALYRLRTGSMHKSTELPYLSDRVGAIVHSESWGRQAWTRLNVAVKGHLVQVEKDCVGKGLLGPSESIYDIAYTRLEGIVSNQK